VQAFTYLNSVIRPIHHDDSLLIPELPESGPAILEQNVKTVLHLKPNCTPQKICISDRRGLQTQNDLISRK